MKTRITIIAAVIGLLTLSAASTAAAGSLFRFSGSGVLVRQDDGYMITGTLRDADSRVAGTIHGTLIQRTTGFNTCQLINVPFPCFFTPPTCNLLGGEITFNLQGKKYDAGVFTDILGRVESALCRFPGDPTTYQLTVFGWSLSHVSPGEFPDIFILVATVQQITPTLFKWTAT